MAIPGANHPSGSITGNPLLDMMIQFFGDDLFPEGIILGSLTPGGSLVDTVSSRQFGAASSRTSIALGGQAATEDINRLLVGDDGQGGLASMMGMSPSEAKNLQASDVSGFLGQAMPFVGAQFGGSLDAFGFGEMAMGSNIMSGFRPAQEQAFNPGSGIPAKQLGQRATAIGQQVHQNLFSGGSRKATAGFGPGMSSSLLLGSQRMGVATSGRQLLGMDNKQAAATMSSDMAGVARGASAVRDLGGPFASMEAPQLLSAMDQFTMGRFGRGEDPRELEDHIRQMKHLARGADIPETQAFGLQNIAGARAEELGGDMTSGTVGGAHGAAFGAFLDSEQGENVVKSAGVSKQQLMQEDAILTAQAGESETANEAAALMRMGEMGMLKKGTAAFKAFEKLRDEGEISFGPHQFRSMLKGSGVDMNAAGAIMNQKKANLGQFGDQVAGAVRASQWEQDIGPFVQRFVANQFAAGSRGSLSSRQSMQIGGVVSETLRNMAGKSREEMVDELEKKFNSMGVRGQRARQLADVAVGSADEAVQRKGYKNIGHAAAHHSEITQNQVRKEQEIAADKAEMEKENADKGQKGLVEKGVDAVASGTKSAADAAVKVLGEEAPTPPGAPEPETPESDFDATMKDMDIGAEARDMAGGDAMMMTLPDRRPRGVFGLTDEDLDDTVEAGRDEMASSTDGGQTQDVAMKLGGRRGGGGGGAAQEPEDLSGGAAAPIEVVVKSMPPVNLASEQDVAGTDVSTGAGGAFAVNSGAYV